MPTNPEASKTSDFEGIKNDHSSQPEAKLTLVIIEDGHVRPVSLEDVASRGLGHIVTAGIIPEQRGPVEDDLPEGDGSGN